MVAAFVMGSVFTMVVVLVGRAAMLEERDEVAQAFRTVANIDRPTFSMEELSEAGPALRARVMAADGRLIDGRGRMPDPPADLSQGFKVADNWLFYADRYHEERIVVARELSEVKRGQAELATILAALWIPLSLLVGGVTWLAAFSVFRPLDRLAGAVAHIEGLDLGQRLPAPDRAEFGALAAVLNRMLARIEESARRSEQFAADAAHEMRTPLAVIRTQLETTLLQPRTPAEYVASDRTVLAEAERLSSLVDALLRSARGPTEGAELLQLAPFVRETAARCALSGLRLEVTEVKARTTPEEVAVIETNLLDNARRFAPGGSEILLSLRETPLGAELRVVDHGPGIPSEHAERVFERLYRTDEGRNRASGGAGIGLAVCRRLVESRGGTIHAEATPGGGATLVVRWPAV